MLLALSQLLVQITRLSRWVSDTHTQCESTDVTLAREDRGDPRALVGSICEVTDYFDVTLAGTSAASLHINKRGRGLRLCDPGQWGRPGLGASDKYTIHLTLSSCDQPAALPVGDCKHHSHQDHQDIFQLQSVIAQPY